MSSFRRFLAENWLWWLVPLLAVAGLVIWLLVSGPPEPAGNEMQFRYDLGH